MTAEETICVPKSRNLAVLATACAERGISPADNLYASFVKGFCCGKLHISVRSSKELTRTLTAAWRHDRWQSLLESKEKDSFSPKISPEVQEKDSFSSKIFTTAPKSGRRKPNKRKQIYEDSKAKSYLSSIEQELGIEGLLEGDEVKSCFKTYKKLRDDFKKECKANGTSVCEELNHLEASYIIQSRMKKLSLSNTMSKLVDTRFSVGSINFTQQIQSRPRRYIQKPEIVIEPEPEVSTVSLCGICIGGKPCGKPAIAKGTYRSYKGKEEYVTKEFLVCQFHYQSYVKSNSKDWLNVVMLGEATSAA